MANYSQHEEDQRLEDLVKKHKITKFVVDIGAGDGVFLSNSRKFITEYGFRGIMIEPSAEPFRLLRETYRESETIELINTAIAEEDGIPYRMQKGYMGSITHWTLDRIKKLSNSKRHTRSLSSLLKERKIGKVGILSVDTEGYDQIIIKELIENSKVRPDIIITETLNEDNTNSLTRLLDPEYMLAMQVQFNLIFLNRKHA